MIPQDTRQLKNVVDVPFDGYNFYVGLLLSAFKYNTGHFPLQLLFNYKVIRLVLYPEVSKPTSRLAS